jgi:hypothetical protein
MAKESTSLIRHDIPSLRREQYKEPERSNERMKRMIALLSG